MELGWAPGEYGTRRELERDNPEIASESLHALAFLLRDAYAESLVREALSIFREAPSSVRIADAESVLGGCLAAQGRMAEAEPLLRGSWEALKEVGGETPVSESRHASVLQLSR